MVFFFWPEQFFSGRKKASWLLREHGWVVIHKKSSIPLGQEAISKIRSCFYCFYIEEEQNKYNSTKVQLESLRSGNLLVGLPPIGGFCKKAWNWKASHPFARRQIAALELQNFTLSLFTEVSKTKLSALYDAVSG